jgi:hypothetical protein
MPTLYKIIYDQELYHIKFSHIELVSYSWDLLEKTERILPIVHLIIINIQTSILSLDIRVSD